MSYHRFLNLRELFQGDLNAKLTKNVISLDFQTLNCNCRDRNAYPYQGRCREPIVVYRANCLTTGKQYIGCTQQHVKQRMQGHFQDFKALFKLGKKSVTFATHFAASIPEGTELSWVKCKVQSFCSPYPRRNWIELGQVQGPRFRQDQGRHPLEGRPSSLGQNLRHQKLQTLQQGENGHSKAHQI
jgi:hypothetical protein